LREMLNFLDEKKKAAKVAVVTTEKKPIERFVGKGQRTRGIKGISTKTSVPIEHKRKRKKKRGRSWAGKIGTCFSAKRKGREGPASASIRKGKRKNGTSGAAGKEELRLVIVVKKKPMTVKLGKKSLPRPKNRVCEKKENGVAPT